MGEIGALHQLLIPLGGYTITINLEVVVMAWIVIVVLICFGLFAARRRGVHPRPLQVLGELFVTQLYNLTEDALDKKWPKHTVH